MRACVYVFVRSICAGGLLPSWAVLDFAGVVRSGGVPQERHARVGDGALAVAGRGHLQKGTGERNDNAFEAAPNLSFPFSTLLQ